MATVRERRKVIDEVTRKRIERDLRAGDTYTEIGIRYQLHTERIQRIAADLGLGAPHRDQLPRGDA